MSNASSLKQDDFNTGCVSGGWIVLSLVIGGALWYFLDMKWGWAFFCAGPGLAMLPALFFVYVAGQTSNSNASSAPPEVPATENSSPVSHPGVSSPAGMSDQTGKTSRAANVNTGGIQIIGRDIYVGRDVVGRDKKTSK